VPNQQLERRLGQTNLGESAEHDGPSLSVCGHVPLNEREDVINDT